jgi:hypothetical protein
MGEALDDDDIAPNDAALAGIRIALGEERYQQLVTMIYRRVLAVIPTIRRRMPPSQLRDDELARIDEGLRTALRDVGFYQWEDN